jgi:hypothetical protein
MTELKHQTPSRRAKGYAHNGTIMYNAVAAAAWQEKWHATWHERWVIRAGKLYPVGSQP